MTFQITSEVGQLQQVIVHRPGNEIKRLVPSNMDSLLFDDVLWLEKAQEEHDAFVEILEDNGAEVLYLQTLLAQALADEQAREYTTHLVFDDRIYGVSAAKILHEYAQSLTAEQLAELLICGATKAELIQALGERSTTYFERVGDDDIVVRSLPNQYFTRDPSAWIGRGVAVNSMQMRARQGESLNLDAIYRFHPMFRDVDFEFWSHGQNWWPASVEGGDICVASQDTVIIGVSERTTVAGFERLATRLLTRPSGVQTVIGLMLEEERAQMHLDTVMTMIDTATFLQYNHMGKVPTVVVTCADGQELSVERFSADNMYDVIAQALGVPSIRVLSTPQSNIAAQRGQWNDAFNLLALRPNVVCAYDRNITTVEYLRSEGVEVITTPGGELGRGRGGPRCMSCPIKRAPLQ